MYKPHKSGATKFGGENLGLKAVLDKALESYDKLPMLETVFERLVRLLTTALRNLTSETVDITIKSFSSERFASFYNTIKSPTSLIVFKVIEWENLGLIVIDRSLIFSLVDILLGGKKNLVPTRLEERSHTYIEQAIIRQIADVVLSELSSSFDPISPATCIFERLESNPNFAAIARPGDAVILLKLHVDLDGKGGMIDIAIPYVTIEPIKPLLQQVFIGEKFGSDSEWEEALKNKLNQVDIPIEAIIEVKPHPLSYIANLKVGDTIMTTNKEEDEIIVHCEGIKLFKGQVGKIENKMAVNLTDFIEKNN